MKLTLLVLTLAVGTLASYQEYPPLYEDMLVQELYQHLNQLANKNSFDDNMRYPDYNAPSWADDIALESRESGETDLRDHEYLEHSSTGDGFQYISGGAGEGKQHLTPDGDQDNTQEVKSDEMLPFYCHPPNPCPKGKTAAKDGCHESITDSAEFQQEWILKMQSRGMCACDEEHMFKCPHDQESDDYYMPTDQLDEVLDRLVGESPDKRTENPYLLTASKREYLVPKKHSKSRTRRSTEDMMEKALAQMKAAQSKRNPYLDAPRVRQVAKKG